MSASSPRSLADQLRGWPDERLARLLAARPDLATPAPHDSAQLAARVVVRTSVLRALDRLDTLELAVLQALVQGDDPRALPADGAVVETAEVHLADLALVWGDPLRPVTAVADLLRLPAGPAEVALDGLDERARAVLDTLAPSGAEGRWSGRAGPTADLVAAGLLARSDERHVTVPWSVRVAVHADADAFDRAPEPATSSRDQALVDRAAAGAAFELVRRTDLLLDLWGTRPPAALRSGGLSVRDLKAACELLHLETPEAALVIETAAAAGLLAVGSTSDLDAAWLPTEAYDGWQLRTVAERWLTLAQAWLDSPRLVALVGTRVADKPVNALAPDLERAWLRDLRHDLLAELTALPEGEVLAAGTGAASVVRRLRWRRPRRPASRWDQVAPLLSQAAQVGLVALDGAPTFARVLLDDDAEPAHASKALAPLLPEPVDHVLVQADLTAIAPGPLEHDVAKRLAMVADVESRGGATVYRFAAGSVRRAFDAGWSSAEVHAFLDDVSRTPVPQSLTYLVDDVSRRFGTVRAGVAESFLRSDDEAALAELVNAPGVDALRLRRIAPTVVVSDVPLSTLLPRLRELGVAPVVEASDGTVRVARPDVFRARSPRGRVPVSARTVARGSAVVAAIRAGDRTVRNRADRAHTAVGPTEVIALLREHLEGDDGAGRVVIGYVGDDGTVGERIVLPRRVEGGRLAAFDERSEAERSFALHRITAATVATRS